SPATDQRGYLRPAGTPIDAGSFEFTRLAAVITINPSVRVADGVSGPATGINGEDLSYLLTLPTQSTLGHHLVPWSFAGNADYQAASGVAAEDVVETPSLVVTTAADGVNPFDELTSL